MPHENCVCDGKPFRMCTPTQCENQDPFWKGVCRFCQAAMIEEHYDDCDREESE